MMNIVISHKLFELRDEAVYLASDDLLCIYFFFPQFKKNILIIHMFIKRAANRRKRVAKPLHDSFSPLCGSLYLRRRKISRKTLETRIKTAGFPLDCPFIFARECSFKRTFFGKILNIPPYSSNTRFYSLVSDA